MRSKRSFWGWLSASIVAAALAIGIVIGVVNPPNPPPVVVVDPLAYRIEALTTTAPIGQMAPLAGLSVRDPLNRDRNGRTVDQGPLALRFLSLPMGFYRHTAGSYSYKVTSVFDPTMQYTLNTVLPALPQAVQHDFTWPPSLPPDQVPLWVTERTGRISLANEPPIHIGPRHEFATVNAYVDWAVSIVAANPSLADHFYVQSGKPEFLQGEAPESIKLRHTEVQTGVAAAVLAGRLPARIITTHKLLPDYGNQDWYTFYGNLLNSYRQVYGADVRVCFQEYNWREEDTLSQDVLLSVSHFLLVLSRLRYEQGAVVDGAAYHQGSSVKGSAVIGQDASGDWTASALTVLWENLAGHLVYSSYVPSIAHNRPTDVALEVFRRPDGTRVALFSNRSDKDEAVLLPGAPAMGVLFANRQALTNQPFTGVLPAQSCGVINL